MINLTINSSGKSNVRINILGPIQNQGKAIRGEIKMKAMVIYQTKYGSCRQYAEWISEALSCLLLRADQMEAVNVLDYDVIIFGAPIYAGNINHHEFFRLNPSAKLVIYTVGIVDPQAIDFTPYLKKNFPQEIIDRAKFFHFRGALNYNQLSLVHKLMLWAIKKFHLEKMELKDMNIEERTLLESYGKNTSYLNQSSILPLIEYIKSLEG